MYDRFSRHTVRAVGRVAIRTSDGRYLQSNGQLVDCSQVTASSNGNGNGASNGAAGCGGGPGPACLFALEVRAAGAQSGVVFRDERGDLLNVSGTRHTLRSGGTPGFGAKGGAASAGASSRGSLGAGPAPSREDVFLLERSIAQMALKSCANGKFISSKQGMSAQPTTSLTFRNATPRQSPPFALIASREECYPYNTSSIYSFTVIDKWSAVCLTDCAT